MTDVKNIMECLDLLEKLGTTVADSLEDGKINVWDLPKVARLWDPAKKALEDIQKVLTEATHLDGEAIQLLLVKGLAVGKAWASIFMGKAKLAA